MKFVAIVWHFLITVIFFKPVLLAEFTLLKYEDHVDGHFNEDESPSEETSTPEDSLTTQADPPCEKNFSGSDTFRLLNQKCTIYNLNLEFNNEASIINVTMFVETNDNLLDGDISDPLNIKVDIYESTDYNDSSSKNILQEVWRENSTNMRIYLSRSSKVYINIFSTGIWADNDISFSFDEIEYSLDNGSSASDIGSQMFLYRPNSVTFYSLLKQTTNKRKDGVEIKFENLIIDKERGEYLLIGPGIELFGNQHFKPLYVTELTKYSTFYVGTPDAYVAFVSGSTQKNGGFKIAWNRTAVPVPPQPENYLGDLNSSLICFKKNSTLESKILENKEEERFKIFRQEFAIFINSKEYYNGDLDETSVILYGYPKNEKVNSSETLELIIKIMDKGRSIFKWSQLQKIIGDFVENKTDQLYHGYRVTMCPLQELPNKDGWSFIIYAMAPMFALCALMIWAWKQNIFAQKCKPEKKDEMPFSFPSSTFVEPTTYENTIPKDFETSEDAEYLNEFLSRRRSRPRPSIQSLRDLKEEASELEFIDKPEPNENEHLYESFSRGKNEDETRM